ncbi:glycoside hydrolase family 97 C-terminal domain-containing protein [Pontibacter sp. XAAS-A31]|nr:glycoside hydrolase family 97 C-terminal domain-containing protein [Pontibacter harenae]
MKQVPTTWDETVLIDGYPGKYCVLARRHGGKWYIAGVNAQTEPLELKLSLPMLSGKEVKFYGDEKGGISYTKSVKVNRKGELKIAMQPNGGVVIVQ